MNEQATVPVELKKEVKTSDKYKNSKIFKDLPKVNLCFAIFILIVNILLPGVGTMILGCFIPASGEEKAGLCYGFFAMGLYQLILTPCLIGWIWAIATGVLLIALSCEK